MKNFKDQTFTIPHELMCFSKLGKAESVDIKITNDTIVVTDSNPTITQAFGTIALLQEIIEDLKERIADECGYCHDCFECGNNMDIDEEVFEIIPEDIFDDFLCDDVCLTNLHDLIVEDGVLYE